MMLCVFMRSHNNDRSKIRILPQHQKSNQSDLVLLHTMYRNYACMSFSSLLEILEPDRYIVSKSYHRYNGIILQVTFIFPAELNADEESKFHYMSEG